MRTIVTAAALLLTAGQAAAGLFDDDCRHTSPRNASAPAAGISRVVIHAEAGSLTVRGVKGATQVAARGQACSSDSDDLAQIALTTRRAGGDLHIEATTPKKQVTFGFYSARLDFTVEVPEGIAVAIDDDSGWIRISGTGNTTIDDDSGAIEVRDVRGPLTIDDDSGAIDVDGVAGGVRIEDDSGEITVRNATGSVEIEDDSGAINIAGVGGSVLIREDDSGAIEIRTVKGAVTIDRDGSGAIDVADIGGDFTVGHKRGGRIDHVRVAGRVKVPRDRD